MSNDKIEEQLIEDIEEKDLVENQELEAEETVEEVSEEIEVAEDTQPLSDTVLNILSEKSKKNEAEHEDEDETSEGAHEDDEEKEEAKTKSEGKHSDEEEVEEDEDEEMEEAKTKSEGGHEDDEEVEESVTDDEEEAIAANDKASDDSIKNIGKLDDMPEVTTKAGYLAASFGKLKGMRKSALMNAYSSLNPVTEGEHEDEMEEMPKLKADMINAMYGQLKNMKKDDLMAAYGKIMSAYHEDVNEEVESDHFAEDLRVLAEADQNLTDDFKQKASILFEGAIANKTAEIKEALEAQYADDLQEEIGYVRNVLVEKIDSYLGYVVESWIEENQEFVDNKLRTEIAENFMKALQGVFTEHYIEVPDSKVDLVDELAEKINETQSELESVLAERKELAKQVTQLSREKIIKEATADLATTQAEKLISLLDEVDYVDSETFASKVETIKEGFFKDSEEQIAEEVVESTSAEVQTIVEGEVKAEDKLPADMAKYVKHLSRFNK